ncbi:hypothetical protein CLV31_10941 [Algoriphagus aquaeductus]|uniref:Uncharacterized protein n=1 Tax=Algoriphagus aquaeductus TaxID=475299 RepID=A0A326RRH5_9BACT|nr:hypothetical protein CLV31_10941 [Algoriphagus aquaeductus]
MNKFFLVINQMLYLVPKVKELLNYSLSHLEDFEAY